MTPEKRVSFLVDGFNLYHSLDQLNEITGASVKWLDLKRLCTGYLQAVRQSLGERVELANVYYFSATADFLLRKKPETVHRHLAYIDALRSTGVRDVLSRFKTKDVTCPKCGHEFQRHEEKRTDVAIGVKLIDMFARNECQCAVIVTGDTDLVPAVEAAKGLFPHLKIGVGFPFNRHNHELVEAVDFYFSIRQKEIEKAQLPREVALPDGRMVSKPTTW